MKFNDFTKQHDLAENELLDVLSVLDENNKCFELFKYGMENIYSMIRKTTKDCDDPYEECNCELNFLEYRMEQIVESLTYLTDGIKPCEEFLNTDKMCDLKNAYRKYSEIVIKVIEDTIERNKKLYKMDYEDIKNQIEYVRNI